VSDRIPHGDIIQSPVNPYVAHRGETLSQKGAGIRDGLKRNLCRSLLQLREGIAIVGRTIRQVGVAIDQARQHGHLRKVNDLRVDRNGQPLANLFNLVVANKNDLIAEHRSGLRIH
jgi:hypothetical protein